MKNGPRKAVSSVAADFLLWLTDLYQELMVHDDSRSGERTSHTVATATTIFYFLLLDLLTRPLTITQVVYHVRL
jgi:hypothetical protein